MTCLVTHYLCIIFQLYIEKLYIWKKNTMFLLKTQMQCLTVLHFFNCVDAVVTSVTHFPINIMFVHTYTSPLKVVVILNIVTIKYILIITQKHFSNQKKCYLWNKDLIKMQISCCLYIRCDNNNESGVLIGYALETPGVDLKKRCYMSRCKVSAKLGCVVTIYIVWLQWGWQSGIVTQLDVMDARTGLLLSIIIWAGEEFH